MKKIKLLLVFVILIMVSQIGLSQTKKTYIIDDKGNATEIQKTTSKEIELCFESDVPELTDQQVSQLLREGHIQVTEKKVKGYYEQFILFYVPRVEVDSYFLSEDGIVSYKGFEVKEQPRVFSWWYLFAILGIISVVIAQIILNKRENEVARVFLVVFAGMGAVTIAVMSVFIASTFAFESSVMCMVVSWFTFIFAFIFAGGVVRMLNIVYAVAIMCNNNKKKKANIFAYIYYGFVIAVCVFAYLQW